MKPRFTIAVAVGATLLLTGATTCKPIPAKTWKGTIAFSHIGGNGFVSGSEQYFQDNGCNWNGQDSLNGFDAAVIDMTGYAGLSATGTWSAADSTASPTVSGFFLDGTCPQIGEGGFSSSTGTTPQKFTIPSQAKWLEVDAQTVAPWPSHITVQIQSRGKHCRKK